MTHRRIAFITIGTALVLDFFCGLGFSIVQSIPLWHGLYCALANAVTLGGDVSPTTPWGYAVNTIECLTIVPLFGATFSLFTTSLTAGHIDRRFTSVCGHLEQRIAHHHKALAEAAGVPWQPPPAPGDWREWKPPADTQDAAG